MSFEPPTDCYVLFSSHTDGWELYELAKDAGIRARISPTPRAAKASCGVSLPIDCADEQRVRDLAVDGGVEIEGVSHLPRQMSAGRDTFC